MSEGKPSAGPAPLAAIVREYPGNRPIILHNVSCAYCGRHFKSKLPPTKEHVIGRRFVPRGSFDGQWNLILKACQQCNGEKADLEDDISADIPQMPGR